MEGYITAIVLIAIVLIILLICCYRKAPPNEALVVTGVGHKEPKVVTGRGTIVLPILQRSDRLTMRMMKLDVKTPSTGVKTSEGVPLWMDSVVTVQVYSNTSTLTDGEIDYIFDFIGQNQIRGNIARVEHEQQSIQYKNSARMALLHQICPECHAKLKAYSTPQGNFWVCSNYPKCAYRHKM